MLLLSQPDPVPSSLIKLNQAGKLHAAQPIPNVTVTVTLCPITQPKCYMLQLQLHFAPLPAPFLPILHHSNTPIPKCYDSSYGLLRLLLRLGPPKSPVFTEVVTTLRLQHPPNHPPTLLPLVPAVRSPVLHPTRNVTVTVTLALL